MTKAIRGNVTNISRHLSDALMHAEAVAEKAERELAASAKITMLGQLMAGVMHEINNPLNSSVSALYLLRDKVKGDERGEMLVKMAEDEIHRAAEIAQNALGFIRETREMRDVSINKTIDSVFQLFHTKITRKHIEVVSQVDADLPPVFGYPGELRQVFGNIVRNSIEAAGDGGKVCIRATCSRDAQGKTGIRVVVADSGPGLSPEVRRKLGTPFFTTKGEAGTGIGMWITNEIIRKHRGALRFRNVSVRGGAAFSVFIPFQSNISCERVA